MFVFETTSTQAGLKLYPSALLSLAARVAGLECLFSILQLWNRISSWRPTSKMVLSGKLFSSYSSFSKFYFIAYTYFYYFEIGPCYVLRLPLALGSRNPPVSAPVVRTTGALPASQPNSFSRPLLVLYPLEHPWLS